MKHCFVVYVYSQEFESSLTAKNLKAELEGNCIIPVIRFVVLYNNTLKFARPRDDSPRLEYVAFPN